MTYTHNSQALQEPVSQYLDTANILDLADPENATIVDSDAYERRSTSAWQAKVDAAPDEKITLHAIIDEWRFGCYDEEIAVGWLQALRLLPEATYADCYEAMCNLAFFEIGPVALPERVTGPIPPDYPNQDLIAALAPARQGRGA